MCEKNFFLYLCQLDILSIHRWMYLYRFFIEKLMVIKLFEKFETEKCTLKVIRYFSDVLLLLSFIRDERLKE